MRKAHILLLALFCTTAVSGQAPLPLTCNSNAPGWGTNLGTISFATTQVWQISGNDIIQVWSDAVTATACQKTAFSGATWWGFNDRENDFNADCRSNPGFPGDLFTWCAVVRFADQLCPYPWRVPTQQDFMDLHIALGGTGAMMGNQFITDNYINRWGGAFGGFSYSDGTLLERGTQGIYWSLSAPDPITVDASFVLYFSRESGVAWPMHSSRRYGLALRCIRQEQSEIVTLWNSVLAVANPQNIDQLRNATYRWYRNDVLLPQSSGYWIDVGSPIPAGRYSVSVHYAGAEILFLERTFSQPFGVSASPNPINISDELTVEAYGATIERIEVFDMNGVLLNTIVGDNMSVVGFNIPGIHILRIHLDNQIIETLRIVVQ